MAQVGSASALGAEGRRFKSGYPDTQLRAPAVAGALNVYRWVRVRSQASRTSRKATQASLIRCAWPSVNMYMQESCV